ncbi:MAG: hypothetical protein ACSHX6_06860 [Akkermansiaceae bacterium]
MLICTKTLGKRKPPIDDWHYTPPPEITDPGNGGTTLRELLTAIVQEEVRQFNTRQKKQQLTSILSQKNIQQHAKQGKISMGGNEKTTLASSEEAIFVTLEAFQDGLYLVFIDDVEQLDLDAQVYISTSSKMTFVKLTFLTGY